MWDPFNVMRNPRRPHKSSKLMSRVATPTTRGRARGNSGGRLLGEASGLGAHEVFDTAAIEAELEQADLNANHNRRPGSMYPQAKRSASRADAGKGAKRVRWNPDLEEPSISARCFTPRRPGVGLNGPNSNDAPLWWGEPRETDDGSVSEHARRAVALAREGTSRSNGNDDPGVLFLSPKSKTFSSPGMLSSASSNPARPTGRGRGGSEGPSTPPVPGQAASDTEDNPFLKQAKGALDLINFWQNLTQTKSPPSPSPVQASSHQCKSENWTKRAVDRIETWNPWNFTDPADPAKENRGNTGTDRNTVSAKLAGNPFVRENDGILPRTSASNHVDPCRPETSGGGQEKNREERRRRRVSAELEARLHQYQQAAALVSPTTTPTPTARSDRSSSPMWGQDLKPEPSHRTAISTTSTTFSSTTPSKKHVAPATPAKMELPESPTNSQPHKGHTSPVFAFASATLPTPAASTLGAKTSKQGKPNPTTPSLGTGKRGASSWGTILHSSRGHSLSNSHGRPASVQQIAGLQAA